MATETGKRATTVGDLRARAQAAHAAGDLARALPAYAGYLAQRPDDAAAWSNLGMLHRAEQRYDQALRANARAYALDPEALPVLNNYANALADVGQHAQSIELRQKILARQPGDVDQKAQIGRGLCAGGDATGAIVWLEQALAEHPGAAELEVQLAFAELTAGLYARGFETFRARWRSGEMSDENVPFRRWEGEDLAGKRVVVVPEQGHGDAVLMLRFLPWLAREAGEVIVLARDAVARLFQGLDGATRVETSIKSDAPVDVYLCVMDLPRLGLRSRADIPAPARLTVPDDSRDRAARMTRPYRNRLKVGVNWSGSVTYKGNPFRSFSHTDLLPLADIPGVQLFSLYKGPLIDSYRADGSDAFILDAASRDRDLADCAALMREMDLIVTCDTATAHIAGSLGLPTWVLLHWDSYWVYGPEGETTPWYPSMRLFRQTQPGDWSGPLGAVERELRALAAAAGKDRAHG